MAHNFTQTVSDARTSLSTGEYLQAQELFESALGLAQNGVSLNSYLECLYGLSTAYMETGDWDKAESIEGVALATIEKQIGKKHHVYGARLDNLGLIRRQQGRLKEAESLHLHAIETIEKSINATTPELIKPLGNLASVFAEQNQVAKAVQSWERAISICEKHFGPDDPGIKLFKDACRKATGQSAGKGKKRAVPATPAGAEQMSLFS